MRPSPRHLPTALVAFLLALLLAVPAVAAEREPLLWRVHTDAGSVHILGSMHMLRDEDHPLDERVLALFDAADTVVFEIDPAEAMSPALGQKMVALGMLQGKENLSDLLGAEGKAALAEYGRKSGTPTAMFERMQPWLVSLMVTLGEAQKAGYKPELGIDPYLMRRAREADQATAGLETAESQFAVLASPDQDVQVGMLLKLLNQVESLETLHELYRLWRTGDAAGMDAYAAREFAEYPEYYDRINVDRNRAWVPQIVRMAGEGKHVVIVVGALHLVGKDGVPALLEAEGLRVERIACTRCR